MVNVNAEFPKFSFFPGGEVVRVPKIYILRGPSISLRRHAAPSTSGSSQARLSLKLYTLSY